MSALNPVHVFAELADGLASPREAGDIRLVPWPNGYGVTLVSLDPEGEPNGFQLGVTTSEAVALGQALVTLAWRLQGEKVIQ